MSISIDASYSQILAGGYFPLRKGAANSLPHLTDSLLASSCPFKSPPVSVSPWKGWNEEYRSQIRTLDLRKIETDFAHMDASALGTLKKMCLVIAKREGDVYSIAPEIVDPRIPLKNSLTVERSLGGKKTPLKMKKKPQYGMCGKVKFVRFKGDPVFGRWFAIKRPLLLFRQALRQPFSINVPLKDYENNLNMLLKVGDHPNFMKVCGIVVKEGKKGAKPYLILEYIEGTRLRDIKRLSLKENLHILVQLKDAFTHLLSLGIVIRDGNLGNFLVAEGNLLKIIDFDHWECSSAFSEQGAQKLYAIARVIAEKLGNFNCPPHVISHLDVKQSFEESMAHLIEQFRISSR